MANANWQGGHAKGRAQAHAWIQHNDKDRREELEHSNRDIDKSRTHLNFEVGPTAGMSYAEKCARLDAILDEWGYPEDEDLGPITKQTPTSMLGSCVYAPDDLQNDGALRDGRLKKWFEAVATEAGKMFGEENIISFLVDVDEVHEYTDAETGERKTSKFHGHLAVAPVVEKKVVRQQFVYLTPEGEETLNEDEAQRVYITVNNSETDDEEKAARNDDGTPKMGPKHARQRNGRRKIKKGKRSEATETKRTFSGAEFASEYIEKFNEAVHKMTAREFDGMKWNMHELGTYQRQKGHRNRDVEELKAETVERETAAAVAAASAEIAANVDRSEALLAEAENDRLRAQFERYGSVTFVRDGKAMSKPLPPPEDGVDLCEYAAAIDEKYAVRDLTDEGLGFVLYVSHSPRVRAARAERAAQAIREDAEAKAAEAKELMQEVDKRSDEALERMGDAAAQEAALDARKAALDKREAELKAQRAALERQRVEQDARATVLDEQERELAPLLKMVRAFLRDPVTFIADAVRRVQRYVAEVAHGDGASFETQLTNEADNAAVERTLNLMYSHADDPDMRAACAPNAPAPSDDERSAPIFDADAWLEDRRRRRAAKSTVKMARQSLQQRLTQQPEQQPVHEVRFDDVPKTSSKGYDFDL